MLLDFHNFTSLHDPYRQVPKNLWAQGIGDAGRERANCFQRYFSLPFAVLRYYGCPSTFPEIIRMNHLLLVLLALLAFNRPALAEEAPARDPRNHPSHFDPAATLCDDTLQWLMIQRLAPKLGKEKLSALGKVQLAYEKREREFEEKHGREVDEIAQAFGNTVRMPAKQREPLMRKLIAISDSFPDVAGFQKQILNTLSVEEAAPLIKLLRDRRQVRLTFLSISPGILEETTLPKAAQATVLKAIEPVTRKAYPYRSTAENIGQWLLEQSQLPGAEPTKSDLAKLDRLLAWVQHRRFQVMNEALLTLRADLPGEDFAAFESYLRETGKMHVASLERISQAPPQDAPLSSIGIRPGEITSWIALQELMNPLRARHPQDSEKALPKEKIEKLGHLRDDYDAAEELFEKQHGSTLSDAIRELDHSGASDPEKQEALIARILALSDKLPASAEFQRAVFAELTPEESAPLTKLLRERRQVWLALLPPNAAGITSNLDVSKESKALIESELSDAANRLSEQHAAFEKLDAWRTKQSLSPLKTIEAMRENSPVAKQLNWLLIEMIEDIEMSLSLLEYQLPEADYAKLEARDRKSVV